MEQVNQAIDFLLGLLASIFALPMGVFESLDQWLRSLMTSGGIPEGLQTLILIVLGVLFLVLVLRSLGGFLRIVLSLLLILLLIHLLLPLLSH